MLGEETSFQEGETVIACQAGVYYKAKVLRIEAATGGQRWSFIHYIGWKNDWDDVR